jgi:phosphate:Na+ symporter
MQKEVTVFLCKVMEKSMSTDQSKHTQALIKVADEYESIADYLERIVTYKSKIKGKELDGISTVEYDEYMVAVWDFFHLSTVGLFDIEKHDIDLVNRKSEELRIWANDMRDKHLDRVSRGEYEVLSALTYSDMVVALRKIRAHALNVAHAITTIQKHGA